MDKKSVERRKKKLNFDNKKKASLSLIVGIVAGLVLVCAGGIQLYSYRKELGNRSVEELSTDSEKYAREAGQYEKEKNAEFEENGTSDKYLELSEKWAQAVVKMGEADHSLYMVDSGYHNPRNLWELITTVPLLVVGILCFAAGFVAHSIFNAKAKEDRRKKQEESKKKEEKK